MSTMDQLEAERRAMTAWLRQVTADPAAAPVLRGLSAAWERDDTAGWDAALAEIRRLWTLRPDATRYATLHARLTEVAPEWAAAIDAGDGARPTGEAALRAWRWRQAQTWFDEVVGGVDTGGARPARRAGPRPDPPAAPANWSSPRPGWRWRWRLDDRRKAALADWTAALRKIGKGTGQDAPRTGRPPPSGRWRRRSTPSRSGSCRSTGRWSSSPGAARRSSTW